VVGIDQFDALCDHGNDRGRKRRFAGCFRVMLIGVCAEDRRELFRAQILERLLEIEGSDVELWFCIATDVCDPDVLRTRGAT
jgi:hypothetical protein